MKISTRRHNQYFKPSLEIAGAKAERQSDHNADHRGKQPYRHGNAPAVNQPRKIIAARAVQPQRMQGGRGLIGSTQRGCIGIKA